MTPNNADLPTLTNRWIEFTNRIEDGAKQLQDHAYALGYERARLDAKPLHDELVASLRAVIAYPLTGREIDIAGARDARANAAAALAKLPGAR